MSVDIFRSLRWDGSRRRATASQTAGVVDPVNLNVVADKTKTRFYVYAGTSQLD